jgi:hypothetical protein
VHIATSNIDGYLCFKKHFGFSNFGHNCGGFLEFTHGEECCQNDQQYFLFFSHGKGVKLFFFTCLPLSGRILEGGVKLFFFTCSPLSVVKSGMTWTIGATQYAHPHAYHNYHMHSKSKSKNLQGERDMQYRLEQSMCTHTHVHTKVDVGCASGKM